jgi:hypothetical protein
MTERQSNDLFWGIVLIIAGGVFLADNLGFIDLHITWRTHWPVILILIGIATLLKSFVRKERP